MSGDGRRFVVGASRNDDAATNAGQVRIYDDVGGVWTPVGGPLNGTSAGDELGRSVSVSASGGRVAAGATGYVLAYELKGGVWTAAGGAIAGPQANDRFGHAIDLCSSGARLAVSAPRYDNGSLVRIGLVRVYEYENGAWSQIGSDIYGVDEYGDFGISVALSGDGARLAIGASSGHYNGSKPGYVQVYGLSSGEWVPIGGKVAGDTHQDGFGASVSLSFSGSRLAVGCADGSVNNVRTGYARVYDERNGGWTAVGGTLSGDDANDLFGTALELSDDGARLVVGAPNADVQSPNSGVVRVYTLVGGSWTQVGGDLYSKTFKRMGNAVCSSASGLRIGVGISYQNEALVVQDNTPPPAEEPLSTGFYVGVFVGVPVGLAVVFYAVHRLGAREQATTYAFLSYST